MQMSANPAGVIGFDGNTNNGGPLFTCLSCNKAVTDIEKHLIEDHDMKDYDVVDDPEMSKELNDLIQTSSVVVENNSENDQNDVHGLVGGCSTTFNNEIQFITEVDYELLDNSDGLLFTCHFCQMGFETFVNLKDHTIMSHNYVVHRKDCSHCKILFDSHQKFIEHMKEKHPIVRKNKSSVPCLFNIKPRIKISIKANSSSDEDSDPSDNKKARLLFCEACGKTFISKCTLNNHLRTVHERQIEEVSESKNKTANTIDLESIDSKQISFSCADCNISFSQMRDLKQHKNEFHGSRSYLCYDCDTVFESRGNLNLHNIYHHRIHRCSTCSIGFPGRLALTNHVKQHHPGMPIYRADSRFVCEYCSQSFSIRSQLSDHIQSVHLGLVNQCEDCGKVLSTSETLKVHRLKHKPEMHRTCEHCGRQFYRTGMLTEHIRACHPEALPDDWRRHTTCPYCQSRFTRRESLRRHIEAKHEPKILSCSFCDRQFTCRRYLVRHENKHHLGRPSC